jgi:hypothetical protein
LFGTGLLVVFTLLLLYVLWRISSLPWVSGRVSRRTLFAVGIAPWVLFAVGRFVAHDASGRAAELIELVGMDALAVVFLAALGLLAADILTGFGWLLRRHAPWVRAGGLLVAVVLSAVAVVQGERAPVISDFEVRLPGLPAELDGTVLVAISDLHVGTLRGPSWLAARVEQIQGLRPDAILLLGDVVEGHGGPAEQVVPVLRQLSAPLGVWGVSGNHESGHRGTSSVHVLEDAGILLLHNRSAELRPGLVLAGVDSFGFRRSSGQALGALEAALARRPPGATILLSHSPSNAEQAAHRGVGLMLSGHTHGGQLWPFGYLTRLTFPLLAGRYDVQGMAVLVCRGTGTWGPRMRLWSPSEILRITLRSP